MEIFNKNKFKIIKIEFNIIVHISLILISISRSSRKISAKQKSRERDEEIWMKIGITIYTLNDHHLHVHGKWAEKSAKCASHYAIAQQAQAVIRALFSLLKRFAETSLIKLYILLRREREREMLHFVFMHIYAIIKLHRSEWERESESCEANLNKF